MYERVEGIGLHSPTSLSERKWLWRNIASLPRVVPGSKALELGTMNASCTIWLADGLQEGCEKRERSGAKVLSVDNYSASCKHPELNTFGENAELVARHGYTDWITLVKSDSMEYIKTLEDESIGMAFVDTWHVYPHVQKELNLLYRKLSPGALICCHDYCFAHAGVVNAVNDFLRNYTESIISGGTHESIWWGIKSC